MKQVKKKLTARQLEILVLCANGETEKTIADKIFLSMKTVANHCANICKKLGALNMKHAIHLAHLLGILDSLPPARMGGDVCLN